MGSEAIEIQAFQPEDARAVSALIRQVFDEHVAPTFEPQGIAEMYEFVSADAIGDRAREQGTFVAWRAEKVVGMIQMRAVDHVALLFVDSAQMGLGIATALMVRATEACRAAGCLTITVNSSLNAQTFYERIGFVSASEPQKAQGFAYVPMEKHLQGSQENKEQQKNDK